MFIIKLTAYHGALGKICLIPDGAPVDIYKKQTEFTRRGRKSGVCLSN